MTKIDKVIKIDNSTNTSPVSFVPKGQNFHYTINGGETLEFKARNSQDALYYVKQEIPGAIVTTQESFDDGPVPPTPGEYFSWTNIETTAYDAENFVASWSYPVKDKNDRIITTSTDISNTKLLATIVVDETSYQLEFTYTDTLEDEQGWSCYDGDFDCLVLFNAVFDSEGNIVHENGKGSLLVSNNTLNKAPIVTLVIQDAEPTPGELVEFYHNQENPQVVSGIKFNTTFDPTSFLQSLTYDGNNMCSLVTGTRDSEDTPILFAYSTGGIYAILVDGGDGVVWANQEVEGQASAGWQNLTDEKYTLKTSTTITDVSDIAGWNGVFVGAVEAQPQPTGLTTFDIGQTITGIDFGGQKQEYTHSPEMDSFLEGASFGNLLEDTNNNAILEVYDGGKAKVLRVYNASLTTEGNWYVAYDTLNGWGSFSGTASLISSVEIGHVYDTTPPTWNGVLIGAVEKTIKTIEFRISGDGELHDENGDTVSSIRCNQFESTIQSLGEFEEMGAIAYNDENGLDRMVFAAPLTGYHFCYWLIQGKYVILNASPSNYTDFEDGVVISAVFAPNVSAERNSIEVHATEGGAVSSSSLNLGSYDGKAGQFFTVSGNIAKNLISTETIEATPNENYHFVEWIYDGFPIEDCQVGYIGVGMTQYGQLNALFQINE